MCALSNVFVIGELCEDIVLFNAASIEVLGYKVWAEDIVSLTGGSAAYVAEVLTHLGAEVHLSSVVGDDAPGAMILKSLEGLGINCNYISKIPSMRTTRSIIICNDGGKDFVGCSPILPMDLPDISFFTNSSMVYLAGYMLYPELWSDKTYELLKELKQRNVFIALDCQLLPNPDIDPIKMGRLDRLFPLTNVFFVARKEVKQLFGDIPPEDAGKLLLDMGCETIALKQGNNGCVVMTAEETHHERGYCTQVYNPIGSGDIFGAAFSFCRINGNSLKDSTRFANVFTALSLKRYENKRIYPDKEDVGSITSKIDPI